MSRLLSTYLLLSQNIRNHENFLWIHGTFLVDNRNTFGLNSRLVELVDNVTTVVRYGQIIGGDFATFCGLLRIYELYPKKVFMISNVLT